MKKRKWDVLPKNRIEKSLVAETGYELCSCAYAGRFTGGYDGIHVIAVWEAGDATAFNAAIWVYGWACGVTCGGLGDS